MSRIARGLGLFFLVHFISATVNDQVGADIDYGTFENPSARVRPRFRYWLPDASVDPATVREHSIRWRHRSWRS